MSDSLKRTFKLRKTHSIPGELSPPPAAWERAFSELAQESELNLELDGAFAHLKHYYENITK